MSSVLLHAIAFLGAVLIIYVFGGVLIDATDAIAKRLRRDGFLVAFVLLGTLTSISEMSVAVNATLIGAPGVSAGNLIGASFVIFMAIIPMLAIFGKGILFKHNFTVRHLILALFIIALPALVVYDGIVSWFEGLVMVLSYVFLLLYTRGSSLNKPLTVRAKPAERLWTSLLKVTVSAVLIFLSGRLLVTESLFFSGLLNIPSSFIGLIIISIGTNIPELVIGLRAIAEKKKAIAFGDFVGSAAFNTLIFGVLALVNGTFGIERHEFVLTAFFLVLGLTLFFVCARSKNTLSRQEGILLAIIYIFFLIIQCAALIMRGGLPG